MMKIEKYSISIETFEQNNRCITKVTNNSDVAVIFSDIPKKPKKKYKDFLLVKSNQFIVLEGGCSNLENISMRFLFPEREEQ